MGIFDKFKKKTPVKTEPKKEKVKKASPAPTKAVVTADGKLAAVAGKKDEKQKKVKPKKEDTAEAYRVLIKPLITEKGSYLGQNNQYIFEVAPATNKIEIRKAIRKVYGVDPIKVNVINYNGKEIRYGRSEGRTKQWKKAIITLATGQKIEIQEGL